eukprot:TRINITY_DN14964_c0_g1_i1.p1 TRINITY_DN14964_c0_g1~~TRINITY_DN14964_c0_g1_i1.p1  ORF type:complete len:220 (-),score=37.17 TRINITY_DN14964_c0_g1_i1:382-1041(-)
MGGCCGCISKMLVKLTAGVIFLSGLGITGYGLDLLIEHTSGVSAFVLSVGGYAVMCGAIGLCLSCNPSPYCTTRLYVVLLIIAALIQGSVAVALSVDKHWAEKIFNTHACTGSDCDADTANWVNDHESRIFWVLLYCAFAEFVASMLACCYSATHKEEEFDDDYYGSRYSNLSAGATGMECHQPMTRTTEGSAPATDYSYTDKLRQKYNIPDRRPSSNV